MTSVFIFHICGWIIFVCGVSSSTDIPCQNRTETCIENLKTFITLHSPRFATQTELEILCRNAENGQACSSEFLRSACASPDEELMIPLQIGRSQAVSQLLCNSRNYISDAGFRGEYLKNAPCIEEHLKEIKECYMTSGMIQDPEMEIIKNSTKSTHEKYVTACCPMEKYIDCAEGAVGTSCGNQSKYVVSTLLVKAAGKQLEIFCSSVDSSYPRLSRSCLSSSASEKASVTFASAISFSIFLFLLLC